VENKHETYPRHNNTAIGVRKAPEDTQSSGTGRGHQVGPANPTPTLASRLWLGFASPFQKLPSPPLLMHLGPWLSWFDPTVHMHPTGL